MKSLMACLKQLNTELQGGVKLKASQLQEKLELGNGGITI